MALLSDVVCRIEYCLELYPVFVLMIGSDVELK